jgi:hypothetical protein
MSEYTPPPPPPGEPAAAPPPPAPAPAPAPKKKSPWLWVGLGCAGLLVVVLIVVAILVTMAARKGKEFVESFEENPTMAGAEMFIRANPELDLVESDREAGTLTIRNKETGEVATLNLEDLEEGRLSMLTEDGEESTLSIGQGEGGFEITTEEGGKKSRLRIGAGGGDDVPAWVPVYPGSQPTGTYLATTDEGASGAFSLSTGDAPEEVMEWYAGEAEDLGLTVERTTFATDVNRGGSLRGHGEGRELNVTVVTQDEGTQLQVVFSDQ